MAKETSITRCISYVTKCLLNFTFVKTHCELTEPRKTQRSIPWKKKYIVEHFKDACPQKSKSANCGQNLNMF